VVASARSVLAQHDGHLVRVRALARLRIGDPRWPLTSCAHRLGKPHRTFGPLTSPVALRLSRRGLRSSSAESSSPRLATWRGAPPRQARPDCHRFKMTTSFGPGRLPSDRPGLRSPGGLLGVCFYTYASRNPAPCRLPRSGPAPSRVGWSLQTISCCLRSPCGGPMRASKDASHRRLQPTYDTSTLRSGRFSSAPPSSLAALRSALVPRRPKPPVDDPSGTSLDGDAPASALLRPPIASLYTTL
jgi:hypothetical protein